MVVRIHQGQLDLRKAAPVCCSSLTPLISRSPDEAPHSRDGVAPILINPTLAGTWQVLLAPRHCVEGTIGLSMPKPSWELDLSDLPVSRGKFV